MSEKSQIKELHVPVSGWTKDLKGRTLKTNGRDMRVSNDLTNGM